jgi:succinylglutamic semialdehyde dehydrogenase
MSALHGELVSRNPADPRDEVGRFAMAGEQQVADAVERARRAFPAWRDLGVEGRTAVIRRFQARAREGADELAQLIARETGKAIWDARGEAGLVPAKVDVSLAEGMALVATMEPGPGFRATWHPRGVLAVLGPFNFPAHLPNGHIVPALISGNTLVFKPSELTPAVGAWMAHVWAQAGLPEGVLEVVQGVGATGAALARHPDLDGVLFTGSSAVGRALREMAVDQPDKLLALEMGGKNAMLVLRDAEIDMAVVEAAISIAATTGQRCSSLSRIFVDRPVMEEFGDKLRTVLGGLVIGDPMSPQTFMGPLVSETAFEKVARFRDLADDAGAERLLELTPDAPSPFIGPGLVRFASAAQDHAYKRDEIFGPEAALYPIDELDEAIAATNDSDYGLVASVMTRDRSAYEHCIGRIRTGLLNWNKGTIGASGKLPFGGRGRSGNDRPAGVMASLYCTTPQSHVESEGGYDAAKLPPGLQPPGGGEGE